MKIILILLFNLNLFACALCSLYTPTAHVSFDLKSMRWEFSEQFRKVLLDGFDENNDGKISGVELENIKNSLLEYLPQYNYLIKLSKIRADDEEEIDFKIKNFRAEFKQNLVLDFELDYQFKPILNDVISLELYDENGFFNFFILPKEIKNDEFYVENNINNYVAFYKFLPKNSEASSKNSPAKNILSTKAQQNNVINSLKKLEDFLLTLLKNGSFLLYPVAFIYGFLHALLPNHGKSISAALFINRKRSLLAYSLKFGFLHLASAMLIASFFSLLDILQMSRFSSLLVAFLAAILLYTKVKKVQISSIVQAKKSNFIAFSKDENRSKVLNTRIKNNKLDNFSALILSLIPCPGLVLVLGFAGLNAFFAAIFIAFGMSLAIYLSAFFVSRFRISKKIEILCLCFIFCLAIFMYFSA